MDDDADAAEARPAFQASEDVVIELQDFLRDGECEFARLKNERLALRDGDGAHEVLNGARFLEIDIGVLAVFEDAELVAEPEVDRAASPLFRGERGMDFNFPFVDVAPDVDVGEDHLLKYSGYQRISTG